MDRGGSLGVGSTGMTMILTAERPGQLLFKDDRTELGTVYDSTRGKFSLIAIAFESIMARGYWVAPTASSIKLAETLEVPEASDLITAEARAARG